MTYSRSIAELQDLEHELCVLEFGRHGELWVAKTEFVGRSVVVAVVACQWCGGAKGVG